MIDVRNTDITKIVSYWIYWQNWKYFHAVKKQNGFYHRECYKTFSNLNEVKTAEKRFNSLNNDKQSVRIMLDRKVGRPSFKQGHQLE